MTGSETNCVNEPWFNEGSCAWQRAPGIESGGNEIKEAISVWPKPGRGANAPMPY